MKTIIEIQVRSYPVTMKDTRTGKTIVDTIHLDKPRLQAAQLVGLVDKDLIYRLYNTQGYRVEYIGRPDKKTVTLDLEQLMGAYRLHEARTERMEARLPKGGK